MASVNIVSCDGCGKETRDRRDWIRVTARSNAFTQLNIGQLGASYSGGGGGLVIVTGAYFGQFEEMDLCSPACAGAALFGRSNPDATAPVAAPTTAGGLT